MGKQTDFNDLQVRTSRKTPTKWQKGPIKRQSWLLYIVSIVFIVLSAMLICERRGDIVEFLSGKTNFSYHKLHVKYEIIYHSLSVIKYMSPFILALAALTAGVIGLIYPSRNIVFNCGYIYLSITIKFLIIVSLEVFVDAKSKLHAQMIRSYSEEILNVMIFSGFVLFFPVLYLYGCHRSK